MAQKDNIVKRDKKITWKEVKRQKFLLIVSFFMVVYGIIFYYWPLTGWLMAFQNYKPRKGLLGSDFVGLAKFQFLFEDATGLTFMECETFEQFSMASDILGDSRPFLTDGMTVYISFIDGKPVSVELPQQVICTVVETEPVVKGQTASSSYKPSILDNGVRVMVPPFINAGDKIVVSPSEGTYVERAK